MEWEASRDRSKTANASLATTPLVVHIESMEKDIEHKEEKGNICNIIEEVLPATSAERSPEPEAEPMEEEEDEEEAEEEEEEDGEEEEDEGTVSFRGDINPLDFVKNDASRAQIYQWFDNFEDDALAEKKRKAIADHSDPAKRLRQEATGASIEEIMEAMNYGMRRKSRKHKRRGRKKGLKKKHSPEITRRLGDATLHYAHGRHEEAVGVLHEVVKLAPNLPEPYHTLGLIYNDMGDKKKALVCYMLAAFLSPKDSSLWKLLLTWSKEQGDSGLAWRVLAKAIRADPGDITLRYQQASTYMEIGKFENAAESYRQIVQRWPDNIESLKKAIKLYKQVNKPNKSISILEDYLKANPPGNDFNAVDVLVSLFMETGQYKNALGQIEHAKSLCVEEDFPLNLTVKAGICYAHLGNMDEAQICFSCLQQKNSAHLQLITEVANSLMSLCLYELAVKFYLMAQNMESNDGLLHMKIAQCYLALKNGELAIQFFCKALRAHEEDIETRLTLASVLLEEKREDEAISLLSPPENSGAATYTMAEQSQPWWLNWKIKLKLAHIYRSKGMLEAFVDTVILEVRESVLIESMNQKVKRKKRLSKRVLSERVKIRDDSQSDFLFVFRQPASANDLVKANRAKKMLEKKASTKEEKKSAALAAGLDWESDDSDDSDDEDQVQAWREPPLPNLLKDEEHYCLIKDLCTALTSLRRYRDALEIIKLSMKLTHKIFPVAKKEELRSLGAQIAVNVTDPSDAFDFIRHLIQQNSQSITAWNCYYKLALRLENRFSKHSKFLNSMRTEHEDLVPPMIITGNQFTMISQHQAAAAQYLEAYKLMPESSLINICAGTALINLALGHRLQNKHQCLAQGLAFLHNNLRRGESQEALYNIARAYHHLGLVSLAAAYYEKVLAAPQRDYPMPNLVDKDQDPITHPEPGYCNLRREAAYNLHLIYKGSGATDLARQVLRDYCSL